MRNWSESTVLAIGLLAALLTITVSLLWDTRTTENAHELGAQTVASWATETCGTP